MNNLYRDTAGRVANLRFAKILIAAFCLNFILAVQAQAESSDSLQATKLKIAFIFKFVEFVDGKWTEAAKDGQINLAIVGNLSEEQKEFIKKFEQQKARNMPVKIFFNPTNGQLTKSDIVFFYGGKKYSFAEDLVKLSNGVLTVSDIDYFANEGGMIEFFNFRGKMRFKINNKVAVSKGIRFNAKLLELAEVR